MPTTRDSSVVLLVQPYDDGLQLYAECLCDHGLAVIAVSDAWDALTAAPHADVIVTGILLAGWMGRRGVDSSERRTPATTTQSHSATVEDTEFRSLGRVRGVPSGGGVLTPNQRPRRQPRRP